MAYNCEEQMSRRTLLRYIHHNRNYNSLKINTLGGWSASQFGIWTKRHLYFISGFLYPETLVGELRQDFEDKLKTEEKKMEAALAKGEISLFRSKAKPTQT